MTAMFRKCAMLLLAVAFMPIGAEAQSRLLPKGESGVAISGGYASGESSVAFGSSVGYSYDGMFNIGIGINRMLFDEEDFGFDLDAISVVPFMSVHLLKQNEVTPLNFSVGTSISWDTYYSDDLRDFDADVTANVYSIGATLYSQLGETDATMIVPQIGISYLHTEAQARVGSVLSQEGSDTTLFQVGVDAVVPASETSHFFVGGQIGIPREQRPLWSISIGTIF